MPFGSIPFTDNTDSLEVRFFAFHSITVIDSDGHHLYHVRRPRYKFQNLEVRRKFQELARERQLLGEFETIDISTKKEGLAGCQVIRVWSKIITKWRPTITMTFLATRVGDRASHLEWDFEEFEANPTLISAKKSRRLNLHSQYPDTKFRDPTIQFKDECGTC